MTDDALLPAFDRIAEALTEIGSLSNPGEIHGLLCGLLCADAAVGRDVWLARISDELASGKLLTEPAQASLLDLSAVTERLLAQDDPTFALLLPDDEVSLRRRADSLGQWCQGFLLGLGLAGAHQGGASSPELHEFLRDLSEISRVGFDTPGGVAAEEDEEAYTEIVEYVRMGVLLINLELRALRRQPDPSRLH